MRGISQRASRIIQAFLVVAAALALMSAVILFGEVFMGVGSTHGGPGPTGTVPPTVMILVPDGGERWTGGSIHRIEWLMTDDEDTTLLVILSYRLVPGGPWSVIFSGEYPVSNVTWFDWTVPLVDTEQAQVQVCAGDHDGNWSCDESGYFAIDSTPPRIVTIFPADQAVDVPLDAMLITVFSEPMNPMTTDSAFSIQPPVLGITFAWSANTSALTVVHLPFQPYTLYTWGFGCGAADRSDPGNPLLGCPTSSSFLTGPGGGNQTGADLTLTADDIWSDPPNPRYGDLVTLYAEIHNIGTEDAGSFLVKFTDNAICLLPVAVDIGYAWVPLVPAGGSAVASVVWDTVISADGADIIHVWADANDTVREMDESNNAASRFIYVSDTPCEGGNASVDLFVCPSGIRFSDDTPDVGQTILIEAQVLNLGAEDAYDVTVKFVDHPPFDVLVVIGYATIPYLPAGGVGTVSISWTATPEGQHGIEVIADPFGMIPESDESNNAASRLLYVGPTTSGGLELDVTLFDNDHDGRYDDVVLLVHDTYGRAVEGASVCIDGTFYGLTPDTGVLLAYNFPAGSHHVLVTFGSAEASATFVSEG